MSCWSLLLGREAEAKAEIGFSINLTSPALKHPQENLPVASLLFYVPTMDLFSFLKVSLVAIEFELEGEIHIGSGFTLNLSPLWVS